MSAQELQLRLQHTRSELESVRMQMASVKRSTAITQATQHHFHAEVADPHARLWQGVGKAFFRTSTEDYDKSVAERKASANEQLDALEKKERYFKVTLDNLIKAITEMAA